MGLVLYIFFLVFTTETKIKNKTIPQPRRVLHNGRCNVYVRLHILYIEPSVVFPVYAQQRPVDITLSYLYMYPFSFFSQESVRYVRRVCIAIKSTMGHRLQLKKKTYVIV